MKKNNIKPTPEAKALSLFLMAYKTKDPIYKEKSKRINRLWDLVKIGDLTKEEYSGEVLTMLESLGGYDSVIERTVQYYIDKTGKWTLEGDDQYCMDAGVIAKRILS